MNILFIVGTIAGGGAEKVAADLANEWSKTREVYIYLSEGRKENEYPLSDRVHLIESQSKGLLPQVRELMRIKKMMPIDFSLAFSSYCGLINALSKNNEITVNGVHATLSRSPANKKRKIPVMISERIVDKVVPVSKASAKDLQRNFKVPYHKIQNIYNPCILSEIEQKKDECITDETVNRLLSEKRKIIVSHGRLSGEKCQGRMIRVMKQVVEKHPDAVLLIMGVGPLEEYLKGLISDLQLQENVYLLGFQTNPFKYLNIADMYIFASAYEGFPIAPLDAMAVGLPIVASQGLCGVRELMAPDTDCEYQTDAIEYAAYGVLTPKFEEDLPSAKEECCESEFLFQQAICEMLDSEDLRDKYRRKSLERIQDFAPERIVAQWEELIKTI